MDKLEVVGVPVGLSLLLRGARKQHAEKVERRQRRNKLQQPWLQLREEKAGSVDTVDHCASQESESVFKGSDQSISEETQGVTDDWLRKQTTLLVEHLSDGSFLDDLEPGSAIKCTHESSVPMKSCNQC